MQNNKIPFYIYPDGIADSMGQDEFILVRNKLGSLDTKFVGDLVKGDYYCQRIPAPIPPPDRDWDEFILTHRIGNAVRVDVEWYFVILHIYMLVQY